MVTVTNPMTTSVPVPNGAPITVTTALDAATGTYTTSASYPTLNINFTGTPQQVTDQLNDLISSGAVTDENTAYSIQSATDTISEQQRYVGNLVNSPNLDLSTPPVNSNNTTAANTETITTTTTNTGGGSVTRKLNDDGTVTVTQVPGEDSTVTTTTTQEANPQIAPQPVPAVNTPTQAVAPGIQTTQSNTTQLTGQADGDSNPQNDPVQNQTSGTQPLPITSGEEIIASAPREPSNGASGGQDAPGRRPFNPLSNVANYNYVLSLYTMTPAAHDAWVKEGRKDPATLAGAQSNSVTSGIYLLCESGGINNTTTQRADGFKYDYYMDNLKCTSLICAKASGGDYFTIDFSFNITEPYGFSFLKNLRDAQSVLYKSPATASSGSTNAAGPQSNPLRGMYILGIKFVGWNLDGSLANLESYNQFYDIIITSCTFKLDGKPVVYNITAAHLPLASGLGTKRGTIDSQVSIQGGSVDSALIGPTGVITKMNEIEANLLKNGKVEVTNNYSLEYMGPEVDLIKKASIVSPADVDKTKWAGPKTNKPSDSNEATAQKSPPNNTERTITITAGTNISDAIGQIIKQSTYLTNALTTVYTTSLEPSTQGSPPAQTNDKPNQIAWYNLSVETTNARWDNKRGDWVYDVKYVITTYDTPSVQSPYVTNASPYRGPYKRYDYWFTGKNTEVQGISINFDCAYFLATQDASNSTTAPNSNPPEAPAKPSGENTTGKTTGPASAAQNSYTSYLYDPAAYQNVSMKILGDPDYLVTLEPPPSNGAEVYNKFYGPDGYKMNPNTGQCFVEVNFLEAIDYDNNTGVMTLNDQIFFGLGSPATGVPPQGIIFQLIQVDNDFIGGKFTQTLTMNGTPWPNTGNTPNPATARGADAQTNNGSGPTPGNNNATAQSTGLRGSAYSPEEAKNAAAWQAATNAEYKDYLASQKNGPATNKNSNTTPTPKTTPTGPQGQQVANDDANLSPIPPGATMPGQPPIPAYINARG